jgi:hypothetical protein
MERIVMSADGASVDSVMRISAGSGSDVQHATERLWNLLHELGYDSQGGVIERFGFEGMRRYAYFAELPHEEVQKLAQINRRLEDHLVADFLAANPISWYKEKIRRLARKGTMESREFYELIGYPNPDNGSMKLELDFASQVEQTLRKVFGKSVKAPEPDLVKAVKFKQGDGSSALENREAYLNAFVRALADIQKAELPVKVCERVLTR